MEFVEMAKGIGVDKWYEGLFLSLWVVYTFCRALHIFNYVHDMGIKRGYKWSYVGHGNSIKLGHIVWVIVDIPAIIISTTLPVIGELLSLKIYSFKEKKSDENSI